MGKDNSMSQTEMCLSSTVANLTIWTRALASANPSMALNGFWGLTISHTSSATEWLSAYCANMRCPLWMGLKDPKRRAVRLVIGNESPHFFLGLGLRRRQVIIDHNCVKLRGVGQLLASLGYSLLNLLGGVRPAADQSATELIN